MTELLVASMVGISIFALGRALARDSVINQRLDTLRLRSARGRASISFRARALWSLDDSNSVRWLCAGLGFVAGLLLPSARPIPALVLGLVGFRLPMFWSGRRAALRRADIGADLPDIVEMLAIATESGLNLQLAFRRVANRSPGPLGDELRRTVDELDIGVSMREALNHLAERTGLRPVQQLVATLTNAERFGGAVAMPLSTFSYDLRLESRRAAEERARRAPVKMLFPLVFLILPAFILLTVVPLLLGTLQTLGL